MMYKERSSSDYLFFRFPSNYLMVLIPFIIGIISYFTNDKSTEISNSDVSTLVIENQYDSIGVFLGLAKLTFAILCAFFITYKWTVINKDGSYGYFLTQGVDRTRFFLRTFVMFYLNGILSVLLGIISLNYLGGMNLSLSIILKIALLTISSTLLVVAISILLGEILSLPELSSIIIILIFAFSNTLDETSNSILYKTLRNEQLFDSSNVVIPFALSFGLGLILIGVSFFFHKNQEVEL